MGYSEKDGKMKNNRVVMVVLNPFVHDARVLREAKTLVNAGYELTVIALHGKGLKKNESKNGINVVRIFLHTKKWSRHPAVQIIKYFEFLIKCVIKIIWIHPHILHCHDLNALPAGGFLKLISLGRIKLIYDSHELWSNPSQSSRLLSIGGYFEKYLIKLVDSVVMTSDGHAELLQKNFSCKKPLVVRNLPEKPSSTYPKNGFEGLTIPKDSRIIVYVGAISPGRGITHLLHAMVKLDPDVILVLLGVGNFKDEISKLVTKLKLNGRVKILPTVEPDKVIYAISAADIGIAPFENTSLNYYYVMPNKVFEYLLAGLPIAVSNFPVMSKLVIEHEVGVVFNPEDPEDIAASIKRILNDMELFKKLKRNVKVFSVNNHWEVEVVKLLNLYSSLA